MEIDFKCVLLPLRNISQFSSGAGHNGPSKEFFWDMDFLCQAGKELTFEGLMVGRLEMPSSGGVDSFVVYVFCSADYHQPVQLVFSSSAEFFFACHRTRPLRRYNWILKRVI